MNTFLKWWLLIVLSITGIASAIYFDAGTFLAENDLTKLSFVILAILLASSIVVGYKIYSTEIKHNEPNVYEVEWFVSEMMLSLGMIGTLIGFIFMLYTVFGNLSLADTAQIEEALSNMAKGMGTAMLTTLVGLISSLLLKCQLMIAEQ